jgi:hypothetical protein
VAGDITKEDFAHLQLAIKRHASRRELVSLLIERVDIKPSPGAAHIRECDKWNGWRFRPEDVEIIWLV